MPALAGVGCMRTHVIRERHATLSLTPEADRARPEVTTPLGNLFLAGDWIQTGLPATVESAVVAGARAAEHALRIATTARARAAA